MSSKILDFKIRAAEETDTENILKIYSYYVQNTAVSFEYEIPDVIEFKQRIIKTIKRYPYFVAAKDDKILGFAYAGKFAEREAYKFSAELSIYIDKNYKRKGIGKLLYLNLENSLKNMGIQNLYARVAVPEKEDEYLNFDSVKFHERLGFNIAGKYNKCGYKFNRWYSIICLEKIIGGHNIQEI